jgi:radical SAM protein with 4Fe4S-binding SPASM domain
MTLNEQLEQLHQQYTILDVVDLDLWHTKSYADAQAWLREELQRLYRPRFENKERIVFVQRTGDVYVKDRSIGLILRNLQILLNESNINNSFVILLSTNPELSRELEHVHSINADSDNRICGMPVIGDWQMTTLDQHPSTVKDTYQYGSVNPLKISVSELSHKEKFLLTESKTFCIYPWLHLNVNPDGQAYPCCMTEHTAPVGNCRTQTLKQVWNGEPMKQVRKDMLNETPIAGCNRCYEQERSGFFSGRQSANKHHGHHIGRVLNTQPDGEFDQFEMVYWDIRFSNLCNLRCRSCGHIYSSQWYQDQAELAGPEWAAKHKVLNYAGSTKTDMWEQLVEHIDYVEQIYFAGGEPLVMDEHYKILEELERRGRFDVRLIYNTNFTETRLKTRSVFDYWRKFDSVSVGASIDAMGPRAEYIRKGTDWAQVEQNRREMLASCPNVDFYVSPTLSIMNALHLPEFHKDWVAKGLIKPQDLNVNILLDPVHYRIDIATPDYKQRIVELYQEHLEWLRPLDQLNRATQGFESAINFITATDNTQLIPKFWEVTEKLDSIRKEDILTVIPELANLK